MKLVERIVEEESVKMYWRQGDFDMLVGNFDLAADQFAEMRLTSASDATS
jgi:hypothetical protein